MVSFSLARLRATRNGDFTCVLALISSFTGKAAFLMMIHMTFLGSTGKKIITNHGTGKNQMLGSFHLVHGYTPQILDLICICVPRMMLSFGNCFTVCCGEGNRRSNRVELRQIWVD